MQVRSFHWHMGTGTQSGFTYLMDDYGNWFRADFVQLARFVNH